MTGYYGLIAAILTTSAFMPQVYKVLKTGQVKDLSLVTFLMIFIGSICWTIHGFHLNDRPIIIGNIITGGLAFIILAIKIRSMIGERNAL